MPVQTQIQVRRSTAATWTSTNPTLAAGELGFETDTGKFKIGTGSSVWTALSYAGGGSQATFNTFQYTATAAQTTFSGVDANGNTLAYTVGAIQVYLNGALLQNTADYTASNGTSVVLAAGALVGDSLTLIAFGTFTVANTIPASAFTAKGQILVATGSGAYTAQNVGTNGQVLTADSAEADGVKWATAAGGADSLLNQEYATYYVRASASVGLSTFGPAVEDVTWFAPIYLTAGSFDRISIRTATSHTGTSTVRLGLYNASTTTGKPSTVVFDAGTVSCTASNTNYEITISQTLTSAGWYYLAFNAQTITGTSDFFGVGTTNACLNGVLFMAQSLNAGTPQQYFSENAITGAFATVGTLQAPLQLGPLIALRIA
jgi:hypothetical protein